MSPPTGFQAIPRRFYKGHPLPRAHELSKASLEPPAEFCKLFQRNTLTPPYPKPSPARIDTEAC